MLVLTISNFNLTESDKIDVISPVHGLGIQHWVPLLGVGFKEHPRIGVVVVLVIFEPAHGLAVLPGFKGVLRILRYS